MNRFIVATLVGLTVLTTIPTSASAFRCLARSSNGVSTWGYGIFFGRAQRFALGIVIAQEELIVVSPTVGSRAGG